MPPLDIVDGAHGVYNLVMLYDGHSVAMYMTLIFSAYVLLIVEIAFVFCGCCSDAAQLHTTQQSNRYF